MNSAVGLENTISCLLCGGYFLFPGPRYSSHLLNEHGVIHDIDFLIQVSVQLKQNSNSVPVVRSTTESECQTGNFEDDGNFSSQEFNNPDTTNTCQTKSNKGGISAQENPLVSSAATIASDLHCYFKCGETFKKECDLKLHYRKCHANVPSAELTKALDAVNFEVELTKKSKSKYLCALCEKTVEGWKTFYEHVRKHHSMKWLDYKFKYGKSEVFTAHFNCTICDRKMKHESGLIRKHLQSVHEISWEQYLELVRADLREGKNVSLLGTEEEYCTICGQSFMNLKEHVMAMHQISKINEVCKEYNGNVNNDGVYQKQPGLKMLNQGPDNSNTSDTDTTASIPRPPRDEMRNKSNKYCSVCDVSCDGRQEYIRHCRTVHGVRFKKVKKPTWIVGKSTEDLQERKEPIKMFIKKCTDRNGNQTFSQSIKKLENSVKEDVSRCEDCSMVLCKNSLRDHIKNNCNRCSLCGKTFSTKANLKRHKEGCVNHGARPQISEDTRDLGEEIIEDILCRIIETQV